MTMHDADPSGSPKPGSGDPSGPGSRPESQPASQPGAPQGVPQSAPQSAQLSASQTPSDDDASQRRGPLPCHKCGYDITGVEGKTCPECGANIGYRGEAFLKDLLKRTRGAGRRRCNICDEAGEFPASGVCPSCGGRSSVPIDTEDRPEGG